ncbi:tRNA1(Val) (adenine(37)-N6)-methyltransferase [Mycoplasma sp. 128]|uniref:tRNA1(Val) (adenine(37)-N6)-methyltransferase n=1 Tax=Mycoplasma sp. 3341 TaxID=3447506 RepID=UPI003F6571E9
MRSSWKENNLGYQDGLKIMQDKEMFSYSVDTILLGNFCTLNRSVTNILEVGTNNAALSIFVAQRSEKIKIDAIEIQPRAVEIANFNVTKNNLENKIAIIEADFNDYAQEYAYRVGNKLAKKYDLIICNPPYYKVDANIKRKSSTSFQEIATHEIYLNLDQLCAGSRKIIEQNGYLSVVLPINRFVDCLEAMKKHGFEPKRIQLVFPRVSATPKFCLIEAMFTKNVGTEFLPNIYLHPEDKKQHVYTDEVKKLYVPIKTKK